ncbi:unnamed protein product [Paramecium octaurelia]|uniref:MsrB domain-containing protein n=1 Tax=Paramecium octaurelia TaxID=43137 RepID=A0A8S1TAR9_PAROT|nr:unnamed protein product [Paramecium octaurelia]
MMRLYYQAFSKLIKVDRLALTPHQYWIAAGKGMERPYTGEYWFNQEVGTYHCQHCDNQLFSFDSKYKSTTGYAQFWNHIPNSVKLEESNIKEERDLCCAGCDSFVGKVSFDGPPPTFIKYSINSAALNFKLKPFQEDPYFRKIARKEQQAQRSKKVEHNYLESNSNL